MGPPRKSPQTQRKGKTNHKKPLNKILFVDRFNLLFGRIAGRDESDSLSATGATG